MKTTRIIGVSVLMLMISVSTGFGQMEMRSPSKTAAVGTVIKAICLLNPLGTGQVSGTITFTEVEGGVRVQGTITGLPPNSTHGMHIHEYGDCSSLDGSSAGGHYNPEGMPHGGPMDAKRHEGDMGNINANESGVATIDYVDPLIMLKGDRSVIGRSVIVHGSADDLKSQPAGNSGPRIACGVIGLAK